MAVQTGGGASANLGSDVSIDDYSQKSVLGHYRTQIGTNQTHDIVEKSDNNAVTPTGFQKSLVRALAGEANCHVLYTQNFSLTDGTWVTANNSVARLVPQHIAVVYDRGGTGNDPDIYIEGTLQAETETGTPTGAANIADDAENLDLVTSSPDEYVAFLCIDQTLYTAADVNRHRWWGVAPGGPSTVDIWHPFLSSSNTLNKGTATATLAGSTSFDNTLVPRVERMHGSFMGVGR